MNLTCPTCNGKCFVPVHPDAKTDKCPTCDGTGSIAKRTIAELQATITKQNKEIARLTQEIEDLQQELGFERQRRGTKR